ncbi:MAG TPA: FAD-dependent oxidoreductase [Burkholderiaceae bacterium]|nr:FAD-dependent oxidoreductase [Burkholderiaceae bacterium]
MDALPKYGRHFFEADVFDGGARARRHPTPLGEVEEPARRTPLWARTQVLVAGGGPAGTAAAIAAARAGADVMLIERHNHLGGLSTGGLVIWIDRMTDWDGVPVIRGIGEELLSRLPRDEVAGPPRAEWGARDEAVAAWWGLRTAAFHGVVTWSPTVSPESLKTESQRLVLEAGVELVHHAWVVGVLPDPDDPARIAGVLVESKQGRLAIAADAFVDATGDADLVAAAARARPSAPGEAADLVDDIDAGDIHHAINTAWLLGGVDMRAWLAFRAARPQAYAAFMARGRAELGLFEKPFVSWRDDVALFMGPRRSGLSALDLEDLTRVEVDSRESMAAHLAFYRAHAPGFGRAYALQMAPQVGARHTRRIAGVARMSREDWAPGTVHADEIGVSPSPSLAFPSVSVRYGALVPRRFSNLLAPGKHLSSDPSSHAFMREIPQCWLTGQAAGVAAAQAAATRADLRALPIAPLQRALRAQGVVLRASDDAPADGPAAAASATVPVDAR